MSAAKYQDILKIIQKTAQDSKTWDLDTVTLSSGTRRLLFLNAHAITVAASHPDFRLALLESDQLLRDGVGLEIALPFLGYQKTDNLNGTDLIPQILTRFKSRRIAIWGSSEKALLKLKHRLDCEGYTNLAPMHHGFHKDSFYIEELKNERPEIIVLCMGMPRQELLAQKLNLPDSNCLIICGGGWANFYSDYIKRAPKIMRNLKMEWLHRLAMEPIRLGKRYTIGTLHYFFIIALAKRYRSKFQQDRTL